MASARQMDTETLERLRRVRDAAAPEAKKVEEKKAQPRQPATVGRRLLRAGLHALWIAIFVGLPAAFLIDLYRQPGSPPAVFTDDDLRAVIVRAEDLPPGYTLNEESRSANDELARYFGNPEHARALLDSWGRQGGVGTLLTNNGPVQSREVLQVATAVERYPDSKHAKQRYAGRGELFKGWRANPSATVAIKGPHIGDQSATSRMYVTDETGEELVVYAITFRTGPVVVDITTTGLKFKDDQGRQAFHLARLVDERINKHIDSAASAAAEVQPPSAAGRVVRSFQDALADMRRGVKTVTPDQIRQNLDESRDRIHLVTTLFPEK